MLSGNRIAIGQEPFRASSQGRSQLRFQPLGLLQLAFPHHDHLPAQAPQIAAVALVALHVLGELVLPEIHPRLGRGRPLAARVAVPETAVDENHRGVARQDDVGRPGKVAAAKPESEPHAVQQRPHDDFRLRVAPADAGHERGASGGGEEFRQKLPSSRQRIL